MTLYVKTMAASGMADFIDATGEHNESSSGRISDSVRQLSSGTPLDNCVLRNVSYKFDHDERGTAIIVNNRHFEEKTGQQERKGSEVDVQLMESAFLKLGFEVVCYADVTTLQLTDIVFKASERNYSNSDCLVFVLMSHGRDGTFYCTNGTVPINFILDKFKGDKCRTLVGKPKLFFIQACRGTKYDHGVDVADSADETDSVPSNEKTLKIPEEADFLVSYSVVPGFFSWRNSEDGSWYIQALSKVLDACCEEMDLLHMLTLVNKLVAYHFMSDTDYEWTSDMKQMPSIVSQLTKLVYLKPKW